MPELQTPRGAARPQAATDGPSLIFDLSREIRALRQETYWQSGRNSKTLVKNHDLRIVLTAIEAKTTIHEHRTAGRLSFQVLEGRLRMHAGGKEFDLPQGRVLVVDSGVRYDIIAIQDSAFLLTVAWPEDES